MDVGLDRHRLAGLAVEVRGYPGGHDEVRVVADEHVSAARPKQSRRLAIERTQVAEMLVDETRRDEVVDAPAETRRRDVGFEEAVIDLAAARHRQHLGRQIDPVESSNAMRAEPGTGPAGSASEVDRALEGGPRDRLDGVEQ